MDITVSADSSIIEKARVYAVAHKMTLNELIVDYLARLVGQGTAEEAAADFAATARATAGRSPEGWKFDRREAHPEGEAK